MTKTEIEEFWPLIPKKWLKIIAKECPKIILTNEKAMNDKHERLGNYISIDIDNPYSGEKRTFLMREGREIQRKIQFKTGVELNTEYDIEQEVGDCLTEAMEEGAAGIIELVDYCHENEKILQHFREVVKNLDEENPI